MPKGYVGKSNGSAPLQPGVGYEGFFQGEWFGVEVLKVNKDTVQVKWDFDGSDSEVWKDYVRQAASKPQEAPAAVQTSNAPAPAQTAQASEDRKQRSTDAVATAKAPPPRYTSAPAKSASASAGLQPGVGYEAFCQGEYYGVEVLKVTKDSVTVKWDFDGLVAEIYPHYVRQAASKDKREDSSLKTAAPAVSEPAPAMPQSTHTSDVRKQQSWGVNQKQETTSKTVPQRNDLSSNTSAPLQPGRGYEAFCQGEYHPVEVVKVTKSSVTVKWDFDGLVAEIFPNYVRQAAEKAKAASPPAAQASSEPAPADSRAAHTSDNRRQWNTGEKRSYSASARKDQSSTGSGALNVGTGYEASCQGDYHSVEILKVMKDTVQVKWAWDGSESEIYKTLVRPAANAQKVHAAAEASKEVAPSNSWSKYKADDRKQSNTYEVADQKLADVTKELEAHDLSFAAISVKLQRKNGQIVPDHCHVKGLPSTISEEQLRAFFGKVGDIKWCKFLPRLRGEDTMAVLLQMSSAEEARAAVATLNGSDPSECAATASVQSTEEADQNLWGAYGEDQQHNQDTKRTDSKAADEPSKRIMDAAVAAKVLRWLPKDAPKDVRSYFAALAECPVSSFGGC